MILAMGVTAWANDQPQDMFVVVPDGAAVRCFNVPLNKTKRFVVNHLRAQVSLPAMEEVDTASLQNGDSLSKG
jgi:hypothetical protein